MKALLLLAAAQVAALPQPDPYAEPPRPESAERLAYAAMLGGAREDEAIERWLAANPGAPTEQRAMLFHRLCVDYGVLKGGEARVSACAASVALGGDAEERSDLTIAKALRAAPSISGSGGALVPLIDNPLGSKSVAVTVNAITLPWYFDTGAEITTLPESIAKRLGVRFVEGEVDVGTSTSARVTGKLGLIERLAIGAATITNVPVFVLPDAMLTITQDHMIPGILGLPVMAAMGRVAWLDGGTTLALGDRAPAPGGSTVRVYWHDHGLGIPLRTRLGISGFHFDSGADSTSLGSSGLELLTRREQDGLIEREVGVGGAGGIERSRMRILPRFDYSLAGVPLVARDVRIDPLRTGGGRIGNDMIVQTRSLIIDFTTMKLAASPAD